MKAEKEPLVSVIICFLNEERFLAEAINSVLKQEYKNWELFLVDDGSTDKSTTIAKEHAAAYHGSIFYLEHNGHINRGLSASRNLGIKTAKGDFVAFLDADDVWLPGKLSSQVAIFNQYPAIGMIAEASSYWYSWANPAQEDVLIPVGADADREYNPPQLMRVLYPLGKGAAPCPSSLILRKIVVEEVGYFEESFVKQLALYEDQAFLSKIYLHENVYISSACNNLYRQRQDSIVQTVHATGYYHNVRKYFLEWLASYYKQHNITDAALSQLLRKALMPYHNQPRYFICHILPSRLGLLLKRVLPTPVKRVVRKLSLKKSF